MAQKNLNEVFLASENARVKIKTMAATLKKSPQLVKYLVDHLKSDGLLYNPHCIFDYSYLGILLFRVYFKGGYINEQEKGRVLTYLQKNPYVISLYELGGEFDLVIEIATPNPSRFHKELRKIATDIPALNNYKVLLNVVTHLYPRWYLLKDLQENKGKERSLKESRKESWKEIGVSIVLGGDRQVEEFEPRERQLMSLLLEDPLMRFTTLAERSGINIKSVIEIFKQLQQRKIVRGFHYLLKYEELGITKQRLFLKLHNISEEREEQLMAHLLKTPEVVQMHKTVGDWTMEVDIESRDQMRIRLVIREIREQFKDIIETFNMMEWYHTSKKTYLPRYVVEEKQ